MAGTTETSVETKQAPGATQSPAEHGTLVDRVFEDFLARLAQDGILDDEGVARLRVALLDERSFSVERLRAAMFEEGVA
jgi:hypothetical protein